MEIQVRIRRDEDGTTDEIPATLTLGGGQVNVHPKGDLTLTERDTLMLDAGALRDLLTLPS